MLTDIEYLELNRNDIRYKLMPLNLLGLYETLYVRMIVLGTQIKDPVANTFTSDPITITMDPWHNDIISRWHPSMCRDR